MAEKMANDGRGSPKPPRLQFAGVRGSEAAPDNLRDIATGDKRFS